MRDGPVPRANCPRWRSTASSNSDRGTHTGANARANSSADDGCTDSSTSADSDNRTSHTRTCPKLLQVFKRLRRRLCKWLVQHGPVFMQWLRWDLVRPDSPERCEAPQGVSAKFRGLVARFVAHFAQ